MSNNERLEKLKRQKEVLNNRINQILAKENAQARKAETREKIIIGGLVLTIARRGADEAKKLLSTIEKSDLRDQDKKSLERLISELKILAEKKA